MMCPVSASNLNWNIAFGPVAARYMRHKREPIRRIRLHRVRALSRCQPLHRWQNSCAVIADGMHRAPSALIVRRQQESTGAVRRQVARVVIHRSIPDMREATRPRQSCSSKAQSHRGSPHTACPAQDSPPTARAVPPSPHPRCASARPSPHPPHTAQSDPLPTP